jgi:hypothetical protein
MSQLLHPWGKSPQYPLNRRLEGRGDPRADLDILEKRKISYPCRKYNPGSSSPQLSYYTDYANTQGDLHQYAAKERIQE